MVKKGTKRPLENSDNNRKRKAKTILQETKEIEIDDRGFVPLRKKGQEGKKLTY